MGQGVGQCHGSAEGSWCRSKSQCSRWVKVSVKVLVKQMGQGSAGGSRCRSKSQLNRWVKVQQVGQDVG